MTVSVNSELCFGHARCHAIAPGVYDLDEDGYCASDGKQVPPELLEEAREGAAACPERAITLLD